MKLKDLKKALIESGFEETQLDSGCNYRQTIDHITFICYIEPDIDIAFIIIYTWNNNDVKGTHNISLNEMGRSHLPIEKYYREAMKNLPRNIGEFIDTHEEVEKAFRKINWYQSP